MRDRVCLSVTRYDNGRGEPQFLYVINHVRSTELTHLERAFKASFTPLHLNSTSLHSAAERRVRVYTVNFDFHLK